MKKFLLGAVALLCFGLIAVAQDIPAFTGKGAEKAWLIDVKAVGKIKDCIVLENQATTEPIIFDVYVYDKKKGWIPFGSNSLKSIADTAKVDASTTSGIGKYPYAAVVLDEGEKYSFKTAAAHNDLYVFVLPKDASYESMKNNAVELDITSIQKKIKDNIRFVSNSRNGKDVGFYIFADSGNGFEFIGASFLKVFGDTCFARRSDGDVSPSKFSRVAIVAADGKKYNYTPKAESNDLYIYVAD